MKYLAIIIAFALVATVGMGCKKEAPPDQPDQGSAYNKNMDGPPAAQEYVVNQDVIADQKKLSEHMNRVLVPPGADGSTPSEAEATTAPASAPASAPAAPATPK